MKDRGLYKWTSFQTKQKKRMYTVLHACMYCMHSILTMNQIPETKSFSFKYSMAIFVPTFNDTSP